MRIPSDLRLHRRHATLAVATMVFLSLCWIVFAAIHAHFARRAEIAELSANVETLSERLGRTKVLRPEQEGSAPSASSPQSPAIAQNTELADRHIQSVRRQLAAQLRSDAVQVEAVRGLPPIVEGGLTATRYSVALSLPAGLVFDAINLLEASTPAIVIETVRVTTRSAQGPGQTAARMQLAVRVYASGTARGAER